jgi:hypothetical protein
MKKTRFVELLYRCVSKGSWRIVDASDFRDIGPTYKSELELLSDLHRYATEVFGCK